MSPSVSLERDGFVAIFSLNDPARRNAMTPELGDALAARVAEIVADESVRAVVLTGSGGVFSAGGDLAMLERLRTLRPRETEAFMRSFYSRYLSVTTLSVPTIAAIEGAAIGAGFCVALACDLRIVAEDAKLALNFAQLGLHPGMGATYLAPLRAGAERGLELLLTGRRFDGREAHAMGMALEAVAPGAAKNQAVTLAKRIADAAPLAVRGILRNARLDRSALERALGHEAREQATSYASRDLGEGLKAAGEKRPPLFAGE